MAFDEDSHTSSINYSRMIGYSIIGGVMITLATALVPNTTLIGASNFGYPFPWLSQLLYPIGSPFTIIWSALLVNILVWAVLAFVVIIILQILKSR